MQTLQPPQQCLLTEKTNRSISETYFLTLTSTVYFGQYFFTPKENSLITRATFFHIY